MPPPTVALVTAYPGDPEGALVAAMLEGDQAAFGALVSKLQTRVYRFILRKVGGRVAEAEDLTQETFLEAFRRRDRYRGASRFSTWVMGIALNLCRNHLNRSPQYKYDFTPADDLFGLSSDDASPHEETQARDSMAAFREALAQLKPEYREPLLLITVEGLPYEEAAVLLEMPVPTVKTRVFRARKQLRVLLEKSGQWDLMPQGRES